MNQKSNFVLLMKNQLGQVMRVIHWNASQIYFIRRADTGRIEPYPNLKSIKELNSENILIKNIKITELKKNSVSLTNYLSLSLSTSVTHDFTPSPTLESESESEYKKSLIWSASAYLSLLVIIFFSSWVYNNWIKKPETIVTVKPHIIQKVVKKIKVKKRIKTVSVSKKRIRKKIKAIKSKRKKFAKNKRRAVNKKYTKKRTKRLKKKISKAPNLRSMGVLSVLGGNTRGSKYGKGLNLKSVNSYAGSGSGSGIKSSGKKLSGFKGRGLLTKTGGNGKKLRFNSGYGTKGQAGGRPGYGFIKGVGASSTYYHPLQEESEVHGGLEKSQIAAVINRNIGQIIYCYEKGLQQDTALTGRVFIKFIINNKGYVSTANVKKSNLGSKKVEKCMVGKLKRWKFPKPHGNVNVKVTYPFVLKRLSHG